MTHSHPVHPVVHSHGHAKPKAAKDPKPKSLPGPSGGNSGNGGNGGNGKKP